MDTQSTQLFYPWYFLGEFRMNITNAVNNPFWMNNEKRELVRLSDDLVNLDVSEYEFTYMNIGADDNSDLLSIIRQLPMFVECREVRTLVILVDKFNIIPHVITHKNFIKKSDNIYTNGYIDIRVYNTFFPTWLEARLQNFRDKKIKKCIVKRQESSNDREFVSSFYENLRIFIERSMGSIYVVSTATFRNASSTENTGNINFEMFPELLLFVGLERFILLVWPFGSMYYYSWGTMKRIKYIELIDIDEEKLYNTHKILGFLYNMKTRKEKLLKYNESKY